MGLSVRILALEGLDFANDTCDRDHDRMSSLATSSIRPNQLEHAQCLLLGLAIAENLAVFSRDLD
jgi:hypothetical protein